MFAQKEREVENANSSLEKKEEELRDAEAKKQTLSIFENPSIPDGWC